jgi:hypothetical protein
MPVATIMYRLGARPEIRFCQRWVRVLCMSSYSRQELLDRRRDCGIEKPFMPTELMSRVSEAPQPRPNPRTAACEMESEAFASLVMQYSEKRLWRA